MVVPKATIPGAKLVRLALALEPVQVPPTGAVANSFTTIAVGTAGVSVLLIKSCLTERETSPFGVTGQEQQEIICSSGENAYTLTQIAPTVEAEVPDGRAAPLERALVMLMTESR